MGLLAAHRLATHLSHSDVGQGQGQVYVRLAVSLPSKPWHCQE